MEYEGRYKAFDATRIGTYPLRTRSNKVTLSDLVFPKDLSSLRVDLPQKVQRDIRVVAEAIVAARPQGWPVILFTGAHLIKNGLGPLLVDLVERGSVTLVAGNGATAIHDFELALIGETSENVPAALELPEVIVTDRRSLGSVGGSRSTISFSWPAVLIQ